MNNYPVDCQPTAKKKTKKEIQFYWINKHINNQVRDWSDAIAPRPKASQPLDPQFYEIFLRKQT